MARGLTIAAVCLLIFWSDYGARSECPEQLITRIDNALKDLFTSSVDLREKTAAAGLKRATKVKAWISERTATSSIKLMAVCGKYGLLQSVRVELGFKYYIEIPVKECSKSFFGKKNAPPTEEKGSFATVLAIANPGGTLTIEKLKPKIKASCKNPVDEIAAAIFEQFTPLVKNAFAKQMVFDFVLCPPQLQASITSLFEGFATDGIDLPLAKIPQNEGKAFLKSLRYKLLPTDLGDDLIFSSTCRCNSETEYPKFASFQVKPPKGVTLFAFMITGEPLDDSQICKQPYARKTEYVSLSVNWDGSAKPPVTAFKHYPYGNWQSTECPGLRRNTDGGIMQRVWDHFEAFLPQRLSYINMVGNCDAAALVNAAKAFDRMFQDGFSFDDGAGKVAFKKPLDAAKALLFPCRTSPSAISQVATLRNVAVDLTLTLQADACPNVDAAQKDSGSLGFEAEMLLKDRWAAVKNALRDLVRDTILQLSYGKAKPPSPSSANSGTHCDSPAAPTPIAAGGNAAKQGSSDDSGNGDSVDAKTTVGDGA